LPRRLWCLCLLLLLLLLQLLLVKLRLGMAAGIRNPRYFLL
jgi:hypothetical protein